MNMEVNSEQIIQREYDYSNIVAEIDKIAVLVKYCDDVFKYFMSLVNEDEIKNEKLKYEFRNYNYKKTFGESFEISFRKNGSFDTTNIKDYLAFNNAVDNNHINNISSLKIMMNLDYRSGTDSNMINHENSFNIIFEPYNIKFKRKSNFNNQMMDEIENSINKILSNFVVANSIFCSKKD